MSYTAKFSITFIQTQNNKNFQFLGVLAAKRREAQQLL